MIKINLNNLTKEMVEDALPYMGECDYQTCIIGRLMAPSDLEDLVKDEHDGLPLSGLLVSRLVEVPFEQEFHATQLQYHFDAGRTSFVWEIANKYIGGGND